MSQNIVGLDIGTYSIKMVELGRDFGNFSFIQAYEARIPLDPKIPYWEAVVTVLSEQFSREGLDRKLIVCGYPGHQCSVRILQLPTADRSKLEKMVPYEIESHIPLDLDEIHHDWEVLRPGKTDSIEDYDQTSVLAVAVYRSKFIAFLNSLSEVDIDPRDITLDALALSFLKSDEPTLESEAIALMDCGHSKTNLCIVLDGKPVFTRTIGIAGREITRALEQDFSLGFLEAETLKQTDGMLLIRSGPGVKPDSQKIADSIRRVVDDLAAEIRQTLVNFEEIYRLPVAEFHLFGGTSKLRNLTPYLSQTVGIPFKRMNYLSHYGVNEIADEEAFSHQPALALALRGLNGKPNALINLRKGEFKPKTRFQAAPALLTQGARLAGFLLLVLFVNFMVKGAILSHRVKSTEKQIESEVKKVDSNYKYRGARHALSALQNQVGGTGSAPLQKALQGFSPLVTLKDISDSLSPSIQVGISEVKIETDKARLEGQSKNRETITKIRDQLQAISHIKTVTENRVQKTAEGYEFDFNVSFHSQGEI